MQFSMFACYGRMTAPVRHDMFVIADGSARPTISAPQLHAPCGTVPDARA